MSTSSGSCRRCPHCDEPLPPPPEYWSWLPPWQCSYCGGLYGHGEHGTFRVEATVRPLWPLFSWLEAVRFGFYAGDRTYVYVICYPSGLPFYVGKGKGQRVVQHYKHSYDEKYKKRGEKERLIAELNERGEAEWYYFMALCDDSAEAYQIEQHWIDKWGIRSKGGLLCNLNSGSNGGPKCDEPKPVRVPQAWEITQNVRQEPRVVHYPPELRKNPQGEFRNCWCPVCNNVCMVPTDLYMIAVQCPFCGHFFRAIAEARMFGAASFVQHWQQRNWKPM